MNHPSSRPGNCRSLLLACAAVAALGAVSPAFAQEAASGALAEVIVTAQKRSAAIQDVPLAVSVLGGEECGHHRTEGVAGHEASDDRGVDHEGMSLRGSRSCPNRAGPT